jgi:hypothetical protein
LVEGRYRPRIVGKGRSMVEIRINHDRNRVKTHFIHGIDCGWQGAGHLQSRITRLKFRQYWNYRPSILCWSILLAGDSLYSIAPFCSPNLPTRTRGASNSDVSKLAEAIADSKSSLDTGSKKKNMLTVRILTGNRDPAFKVWIVLCIESINTRRL